MESFSGQVSVLHRKTGIFRNQKNREPKKYPKKTISIPTSVIWVPKFNIFHFNEHGKSLDFSKEMAKITYTGEVTITFTAIVSSYCQIFGKYYPMDEHKCHLAFQYKAELLH